MKRIITLTLNPAIDEVREMSQPGERQDGQRQTVRRYPAGKGINVARALSCICQEDLHAIALLHPEDETLFGRLRERGIATHWITRDTPTRVHLSTVDPTTGEETHIRQKDRSTGPFPTGTLLELISGLCAEGDLAVISGSTPANAPVDLVPSLVRHCKALGAQVILDTSGPALARGLEAGPDLVKPNLEELEELTGSRLHGEDGKPLMEAVAGTVAELAATHGTSRFMVSLGADGALCHDLEERRLYKATLNLPAGFGGGVLHSVGSGDSMVAGICLGMVRNAGTGEVLAGGCACGAANLLSGLPGEIDPEVVRDLLGRVCVTRS